MRISAKEYKNTKDIALPGTSIIPYHSPPGRIDMEYDYSSSFLTLFVLTKL